VGRALIALVACVTVSWLDAADLIRYQSPKTLDFDDLVTLASVDPPPPEVQAKLDALLSTPFVSNESWFAGSRPLAPDVSGVGKVLRIAEWNINREEKNAMMLALSNLNGFAELARENPRLESKTVAKAVEEARHLQSADVIVLNEVDHGVNRTRYRDVTRDIAMTLHMNYVFATEFIELTPLYVRDKKNEDEHAREKESEESEVDPKRYLGLEGSALLSRYPIRSARVVQLPMAYDWYHQEIHAISDLAKVENLAGGKLVSEKLKRQVRRGSRLVIIVELEIPGPTPSVLTVVCPHLEDYSQAPGRRKQMEFVLSQIKTISTPVVMAGDLNTMGHSAAPVSFKSEIKNNLLNYRFWARLAIYNFVPLPGLSYGVGAYNYYRELHDPTVVNIPVVGSSHERAMFDDIHHFRFDDGSSFEWEGDKAESFHHKGRTLATTDQRAVKGFEPTFEFGRTFHGLLGSYKLDWIFVKQSTSLAPYEGRTLRALNDAPVEKISDHSPTTVDLALPSLLATHPAAQSNDAVISASSQHGR
jgi:endonuclease/exonuclease/phosphatase family metal-dependent hydrolase